jgi:hypothetical protein
LIEVELPTRMRRGFEEFYRNSTGQQVLPGDHYKIQDNKRGREFRVYVAADEAVVDELRRSYTVKAHRRSWNRSYPHRIDSVALVEDLIRQGFRIGPNNV